MARTAVRPVDGELAGWNPVALAGVVGREALERAGLEAGDLDEVVVGCADPVGACGADAARAIVLAAGWPAGVGGHVVDRGETSGLAAVQAAAASIRAGQAHTVLVIGLGLCSVVPPGAAALNRTYGAPWGGVAERFAEVGGLLPGPRLAERAAEDAGIGRAALDAAAEESRRRRVEAGASPAIVAVAARPGDAAARGVYPGDPVAADVVRAWDDSAELPPAFDDDGLLTAATFAPPADGVAAVLLQADDDQTDPSDTQPPAPNAAHTSANAPTSTHAAEDHTTPSDTQPPAPNAAHTSANAPTSTHAAEDHTTPSDTQPPAPNAAHTSANAPTSTHAAEDHTTPSDTQPPAPNAAHTSANAPTSTHAAEDQPPPGAGPAEQLSSTVTSGGAHAPRAALATVAGLGRAAGDPFDPVGNVAVAAERALAEAGVELEAIDDLAVVEHDAATVMLVARALGTDRARINRPGGAVATGNAGAAEELRLITDGLAVPAATGARLLLTMSAGPTGSAAVVWHMHI